MKLQILIALALAAGLQAQVYTPPAGGNSAPVNPVAQDVASNPKQQQGANPLGQEIPLLDPAAETIKVGGVVIPLGDNRLLKAGFEKYLSQPPENSDEAKEYRQNIDQILATVSPFREGGPNLHKAFKMLPSAATYPGDSNLCMSLAESIYTAMLAKQDNEGIKRLSRELKKEKEELKRKADWIAKHERDNRLGTTRRSGTGDAGEGNGQARDVGRGVNSLRYQDSLKRIAEIEGLRVSNRAMTEAQTLQTKAQYQVNMIQWFTQRRFEHVLMASRFYNQIWRDGDATLRINKDSDLAKIFTDSVGVSPTVASLDSLSSEAIRQTAKYIDAFNMLMEQGDLHTATQRLMEAYALGEYLAPVATLEWKKKRQVLDYYRDYNNLFGAMQARDYVKAKELADSLKQRAQDFPSSKVDSAIAGYTMTANLLVEQAKGLLLAREQEKAAEKIKQAAEIWPTNPKLEEFNDLIGNTSQFVMIRNDFDRLLNEKRYREILARQYEIAPVVKGDPARESAFNEIMTNLKEIEMALGQAREFSEAGQKYAAWEQLAEIRERFPDDPKLGRQLELLAPEVAD
ncbi:MAG: hypothetical protein R3242_03195, partial [Akkermansiaceae bacterium]|nr:hypothetical protein [Akkermansiaceae bacterium]